MDLILNKDWINKMGWTTYSLSRGIGGSNPNLYNNDEMVRFFIFSGDKLFVIKELNSEEYLFITVDNHESDPKFLIEKFNDNQKLFSLIRKNSAYSKVYKRLTKLNKIL